QGDAVDVVRKRKHLPRHRVFDSVHPRDAVANRYDRADLSDVHVDSVAADLVSDDFGDFFSFDVHCRVARAPDLASGATCALRGYWPASTSACFIFSSCVVTLPSYTVLPRRVTTPPMIDGSTRASRTIMRPVARSSPASSARSLSAPSGVAVVSSPRMIFW